MFEEETPTGMSEESPTNQSPMQDEVTLVNVEADSVAEAISALPVADESTPPNSEPIRENVIEAESVTAPESALDAVEPASDDALPVAAMDTPIAPGLETDTVGVTNADATDDITSDDFIKEKVSKAREAKKKASATATRARATRKAKEKLPDLGDGSGYEPPDPLPAAPEGTEPAEPVDDALWYALHCYSGYENKVKHSLEQRIETMGMAGRILEVVVPTEEEIEVRDGKRKTVERRVFPGYVIVRMRMSEDSWHVVRNTPGVTRFIGMGNRPQPLSPQEVNQILKRMEADAPKLRVSFKTGQKVRITDGPFADLMGLVDRIDTEHAKVVVLVNFFGRDTPVELDFLQIEKM